MDILKVLALVALKPPLISLCHGNKRIIRLLWLSEKKKYKSTKYAIIFALS